MKIGISGSRNIDTEDAIQKLIELYHVCQLEFGRFQIITGACIGVDIVAAQIAYEMLFDVHVVVPSNMSRVDKNWDCWQTSYEMMPRISEYKDRNSRIVELSDMLIALPSVPETMNGTLTRSGTWQTVRIARKKGIPVWVQSIKKKQTF